MTPERWQQICRAFDHAAELSKQEQAVYQQQLQSDDPNLAAEVQELLNERERSKAELSLDGLPNDLRDQIPGVADNDHVSPQTEYFPSPGTTRSQSFSGDVPQQAGKYRIIAEIARGGMGVVWRVHDPDFQRPLALKILLDKGRGSANAERRFLEEARVAGQLQHPGIAPVHELGRLDNGLPFFVMKLIEGQTLAELFKQRSDSVQDLSRFVSIFENICQTVAYAHSRGVIHRDLKPLNVMVGEFGEVQVMDWGLAKRVNNPPTNPGASLNQDKPEMQTRHTTLPAKVSEKREQMVDCVALADSLSTDQTPRTRVGTVMGTPAYMAPEQARGEIDQLDQRCDVFALGAILCEILTGRPAFVGKSNHEVLNKARANNLADAFGRLEACSADHELVQLAKRCLAPDKDHRLSSATELANAIVLYQKQLQEKLRQAEIEKRSAQVKAEEEHKRWEVENAKAHEERRKRWAQLGFGVAVLILILGGAGLGLWYLKAQNDRLRSRDREVNQALNDIETKYGTLKEKLSGPKAYEFFSDMEQGERLLREAEEALERARSIKKTDPELLGAEAKQRLQLWQSKLKDERKGYCENWAFVQRLDNVRQTAGVLIDGKFQPEKAAKRYASAFAKLGYNFRNGDRMQMVERLCRSPIKPALLAALDHWAEVLHSKTTKDRLEAKDRLLLSSLRQITSHADPDPWRDRVRSEAILTKLDLQQLANDVDVSQQSPQILASLALRMNRQGIDACPLLRRALRHYPGDFWLHFRFGLSSQNAEIQESHYQAALAIRPSSTATWTNLGLALRSQGRFEEAVATYNKAIDIDSKHTLAWTNLSIVLSDLKKYDEAILACEKAIQIDPMFKSAWNNLAFARINQGEFDEAVTACKKAIRIDAKYAKAWYNLGLAHLNLGEFEAAVTACGSAADLDPRNMEAWNNLGLAFKNQRKYAKAVQAYDKAIDIDPNYKDAWTGLGAVLQMQRNYEEAVIAHNKAIDIDPKFKVAWINLGNALWSQQKYAEAVAACKKAIDIDPKQKDAWNNLGNGLAGQNKTGAAVAAYKKAIDIDPKFKVAWTGLGVALQMQRNYEEAVIAHGKAIDIDPKFKDAWINLGDALWSQQKYGKAVAACKKAIDIDPKYDKAWNNLGRALSALQKFDEAVAAYKKAIEIYPNFKKAWNNLGFAHLVQGKYDEAVADFKKAIDIDPKYVLAWNNLGLTLSTQKRYDEAIKAFEKTIQIAPQFPQAHIGLGDALMNKGKFQMAKNSFERGFTSTNPPLAQYARQKIQKCQELVELEKELPNVLSGRAAISENRYLLLARFCHRYSQRYNDAVTLYGKLFAKNPRIVQNPKSRLHYDAACCATLAAAAKRSHDKGIDSKEETKLRNQAFGWLTADLTAYRKMVDATPLDVVTIQEELGEWQKVDKLVSVRDVKALAVLSEPERQRWQRFWSDVRDIRKKFRDRYVVTTLSGRLTSAKPEQVHKMKLTAGSTYILSMKSHFDNFLRMKNAQGTNLAEDDDSGPNLNARLVFTPKQDGAYWIIATSYEQRHIGAYQLIIREFAAKTSCCEWLKVTEARLSLHGESDRRNAHFGRFINSLCNLD